MRTSKLLILTQKEIPADTEIISHQLMVRAGLIRKLASGLYSWLPLGLKVLKKIENIIRNHMNNAEAQEILMPVVQPGELWQESERWEEYGNELLRIQDRHNRYFCLGPTHEEVITDLARNSLQSYKQLPKNFYQIQTKFRDEIRPRFGIMRAREFTMKDSYSFHLTSECLDETYNKMYEAYSKIFSEIKLDFRAVIADSGSIGGSSSHEFHVLAESGEDSIAFSDQSDFAANVELAEALPPSKNNREICEIKTLKELHTPGIKKIEEICKELKVQASQTIKTLIVYGSEECNNDLVALVLRGDHELNELKAEKIDIISKPLKFATEEDIKKTLNCNIGFVGPLNLNIPIVIDHSAKNTINFICGANVDDKHFIDANWPNNFDPIITADIRKVINGDPSPDGKGKLVIKRGIEIGHIFKLGKKYSSKMNASVLNENGKDQTLIMGCYGIGVSRLIAATIEQNHDSKGIIWPTSIAPFQIAIIPINIEKSNVVRELTEDIYKKLKKRNIDVLLDDRNERPGVKFTDVELIGIPHRLTIGEKSINKGIIEYYSRKDDLTEEIKIEEIIKTIIGKII